MITTNTILQEAETYVRDLLTERLTADHRFHDLAHTLKVRDACRKLSQQLDLADEQLEILELAALFHDVGYTEVYSGHEVESRRIAEAFLRERAYPEGKLQEVLDCIDVTFPGAHPKNLLQQIMKDADYVNLSSTNYLTSIEDLRHEWEVFLNKTYDNKSWYDLNNEFLKNHQFFTPAARELYEPQREANRKELKEVRKQLKKNNKERANSMTQKIADSRSAQMMFKTALRNHLDLSNLADNKANIMLSVNALIITIAIPLAATYIRQSWYLLIPMSTLLATCIISMIFATLATRPMKMLGYTSEERIKSGKSNLFFFGNFYRMTFDEYKTGMEHVISNEEELESTIMRDLYSLGHSLGRKYQQLRTTYTVFMVGIVLTVVIFGITYALYAGQN